VPHRTPEARYAWLFDAVKALPRVAADPARAQSTRRVYRTLFVDGPESFHKSRIPGAVVYELVEHLERTRARRLAAENAAPPAELPADAEAGTELCGDAATVALLRSVAADVRELRRASERGAVTHAEIELVYDVVANSLEASRTACRMLAQVADILEQIRSRQSETGVNS